MWYVFYSEDVTNSLEARKKARPAHLERLQLLRNEGRLLVAGPCPAIDSEEPGPNGFTGSVVIAQFDSLAEAQEWAEHDPYVDAGVYASTTVKPFKQAF